MPPKRERRTHSKIFIDKLAKLSGGNSLIGNKTLREELGWDEEKYTRIKYSLADEKLIILGKGKGGSVGLSSVPGTKALNVFVSYSHKDEKFKDELLAHIKPLERLNLVNPWHDGKIKAGADLDKTIYDNMAKSDIILLLVSIDFINSIYCYEIELENAMERHEKKQAVVIPVILRQCLWQSTPFGKLKAAPKDGQAVVSWKNNDEAFTDVVNQIRDLANSLLENK